MGRGGRASVQSGRPAQVPDCVQRNRTPDSPTNGRDRQDYGENVTGDLLGNAIASGAPAAEIRHRFLTPRGLVREEGERRAGLIGGLGGHPLSPAGVAGRGSPHAP